MRNNDKNGNEVPLRHLLSRLYKITFWFCELIKKGVNTLSGLLHYLPLLQSVFARGAADTLLKQPGEVLRVLESQRIGYLA